MPLLYIGPLFTGSWALSTSPKRGGWGVSPLLELFPRGGSGEMGPLLGHHKKGVSHPSGSNRFFHAMSWVWCGLLLLIGASSLRVSWSDPSSVRPVVACWCIKRVCTRPWPLVRPILRPRALTVNKTCTLSPLFWRLSGKWSSWFKCPLAPAPPSRSFLPWGLLTDHGYAAATVFHRSRRRRAGKWNPSVESSLAPDTPFSFFPLSFHLGASTTTTTSTIVTTPRRHPTAGNPLVLLFREGTTLGYDVNLSPPLVWSKTN